MKIEESISARHDFDTSTEESKNLRSRFVFIEGEVATGKSYMLDCLRGKLVDRFEIIGCDLSNAREEYGEEFKKNEMEDYIPNGMNLFGEKKIMDFLLDPAKRGKIAVCDRSQFSDYFFRDTSRFDQDIDDLFPPWTLDFANRSLFIVFVKANSEIGKKNFIRRGGFDVKRLEEDPDYIIRQGVFFKKLVEKVPNSKLVVVHDLEDCLERHDYVYNCVLQHFSDVKPCPTSPTMKLLYLEGTAACLKSSTMSLINNKNFFLDSKDRRLQTLKFVSRDNDMQYFVEPIRNSTPEHRLMRVLSWHIIYELMKLDNHINGWKSCPYLTYIMVVDRSPIAPLLYEKIHNKGGEKVRGCNTFEEFIQNFPKWTRKIYQNENVNTLVLVDTNEARTVDRMKKRNEGDVVWANIHYVRRQNKIFSMFFSGT